MVIATISGIGDNSRKKQVVLSLQFNILSSKPQCWLQQLQLPSTIPVYVVPLPLWARESEESPACAMPRA
jgi:hypothetical protein